MVPAGNPRAYCKKSPRAAHLCARSRPGCRVRPAMNFDFSDDLKALRDEARKFLRDRCPVAVVRRIREGEEPYDRRRWREIAALGWTGAAMPEALGGAGLGHLGLCVLAEELGSALAPTPFSSSIYLAAEAIMVAGSE